MFLFESGFHAVLQYYLIPNLLFYYHLHSAPFIPYPQWFFNNFTPLIAGLWTRLCNTSSWRDISSHGTYLGKESHTFLPYVTCLCHPDGYSSLKGKALKRPNVKIKWVWIHFVCYPWQYPFFTGSSFRQMASLVQLQKHLQKGSRGNGEGTGQGEKEPGLPKEFKHCCGQW